MIAIMRAATDSIFENWDERGVGIWVDKLIVMERRVYVKKLLVRSEVQFIQS
jgi:hypothetical protein